MLSCRKKGGGRKGRRDLNKCEVRLTSTYIHAHTHTHTYTHTHTHTHTHSIKLCTSSAEAFLTFVSPTSTTTSPTSISAC